MVQVVPQDKEVDGIWFRWNVRKNEYELDEGKNRYVQKKRSLKCDRFLIVNYKYYFLISTFLA